MSALQPLLEALIPIIPAAVALVAAILFFAGWRLLRSNAIAGLEVDDLVLLRQEQRTEAGVGGPLARLGGRLVPGLRQLIGPKGVSWIQRQVELAGRPDGASADTVLRHLGMWIILVAPMMLISLLQGNLILIPLGAGIVVVMPMARIARARRLRQTRISRDLPDFLDILSVTVSAGVGFRAALQRVASNFPGPLSEEITLTLHHMANGASRRDAFADLRRRNDSEQVTQFVTAFLQAEELGAPLADTLRYIASDMRRTTAQELRRAAARAAPRVTLVTSLVLLPGTIVLIAVGMYLGTGIDLGEFM
jgi:tight adherence protein C